MLLYGNILCDSWKIDLTVGQSPTIYNQTVSLTKWSVMNSQQANKTSQPPGDSPTKQKIIDAARAEFAAHGKAGARVDRIAQLAGVNKAMIYYHFQSKDNLYMEVIREFYGHIREMARQKIDESVSFETFLSVMAEGFAGMFDRIAAFKPILLRELAAPDPVVMEEIAKTFREAGIPQQVQLRLATGIESGDIRQMDFRQTFISFLTMNLGYFLMAPVIDRVMGITDTPAFVKERTGVVVDIFLNGVKTR
jgi:TetR/AcrR family transcriptional regulator